VTLLIRLKFKFKRLFNLLTGFLFLFCAGDVADQAEDDGLNRREWVRGRAQGRRHLNRQEQTNQGQVSDILEKKIAFLFL